MSTPALPGKPDEAARPQSFTRWREVWLALAAVTAIGVSGYFLARNLRMDERMPRSDARLYEAVGAVMAEETAHLLGNKGKVVLITPDTGAQPSPVHASFLRGFERNLKTRSSVRLDGKELVTPTEVGCPATAFLAVLKKHPTADAVVSFIGPPVLRPDDVKLLPPRRPKLLVLGGDRELTRSLMSQQLLELSLVPRQGSRDSGNWHHSVTQREEVERIYQIITPGTVGAWAAGGKP